MPHLYCNQELQVESFKHTITKNDSHFIPRTSTLFAFQGGRVCQQSVCLLLVLMSTSSAYIYIVQVTLFVHALDSVSVFSGNKEKKAMQTRAKLGCALQQMGHEFVRKWVWTRKHVYLPALYARLYLFFFILSQRLLFAILLSCFFLSAFWWSHCRFRRQQQQNAERIFIHIQIARFITERILLWNLDYATPTRGNCIMAVRM